MGTPLVSMARVCGRMQHARWAEIGIGVGVVHLRQGFGGTGGFSPAEALAEVDGGPGGTRTPNQAVMSR